MFLPPPPELLPPLREEETAPPDREGLLWLAETLPWPEEERPADGEDQEERLEDEELTPAPREADLVCAGAEDLLTDVRESDRL